MNLYIIILYIIIYFYYYVFIVVYLGIIGEELDLDGVRVVGKDIGNIVLIRVNRKKF